MSEADIPALTSEIVAFLRRLSDPSRSGDALDGFGRDPDVLALAEKLIRAELGSPSLSPAWLADRLGISRVTLYRLFTPLGGVLRQMQEQRLLAAREALSDALDMRSLAQVACDLGFGSAALFSRRFRDRFGLLPRAFREATVEASKAALPDSAEPVQVWWRHLGQRGSVAVR